MSGFAFACFLGLVGRRGIAILVGSDDRITPKRNNNTPSFAGCMESMREIPVVSGRT